MGRERESEESFLWETWRNRVEIISRKREGEGVWRDCVRELCNFLVGSFDSSLKLSSFNYMEEKGNKH